MKCKIHDCERDATYKAQQVCQKHYFRYRRYGRYDLRERARKVFHSAGYILVYMPGHPLAQKSGMIYEHRVAVYSKYADDLPPCAICGAVIDWGNCHIDHIDEDRSNNDISNLRPLCRTCNVMRGRKSPEYKYKGHYAITCNGVTKTPCEWARDENIFVSIGAIIRRKKRGMSDEDALHAPKVTHKRKALEVKHERT